MPSTERLKIDILSKESLSLPYNNILITLSFKLSTKGKLTVTIAVSKVKKFFDFYKLCEIN